MSVRAFSVFLIIMVLVRLAGMRTFAKKSSVDNIIVIMPGAILARAVVGASKRSRCPISTRLFGDKPQDQFHIKRMTSKNLPDNRLDWPNKQGRRNCEVYFET